ncbi:UNVERIFIED_CONTAM: hypothetical protein FKN15_050815 [Acipenser sinensis]
MLRATPAEPHRALVLQHPNTPLVQTPSVLRCSDAHGALVPSVPQSLDASVSGTSLVPLVHTPSVLAALGASVHLVPLSLGA